MDRLRQRADFLAVANGARATSAAFLPVKTPRKQIYSCQLCRFKEARLRHGVTLTKTGASRISRAIVRDGPVIRGRLIWGRKWPVLGRPASPDLPQFSGKIAAQNRSGKIARSAENYP